MPGGEDSRAGEQQEELEEEEEEVGTSSPLHPPAQGPPGRDGQEEEEEEVGDHSSVHSCDTEGYYTTFHDFDGFQVRNFRFPSML